MPDDSSEGDSEPSFNRLAGLNAIKVWLTGTFVLSIAAEGAAAFWTKLFAPGIRVVPTLAGNELLPLELELDHIDGWWVMRLHRLGEPYPNGLECALKSRESVLAAAKAFYDAGLRVRIDASLLSLADIDRLTMRA